MNKMRETIGETKNIAEWVSFQASQRPYQRALVFPEARDDKRRRCYSQLNFQQTESMINRFARGFQEKGIQKGDRVCVFVTLCLEFMPIVFALYKIGAIVVLIDPGMGRKGLLSCVERIAPVAMVAVPKAMIATTLFPKKFRSVKLKITVGGGTWIWGGLTLQEVESQDDSPVEITTSLDDEASILFTSGSTGPAKGVRYTHRILDSQTRQIRDLYGIEAGEIDLPCFPLFGLFTLAQGLTVVIPEMDPTKPAEAAPELLVEAILDHGCTSTFASPALWKTFAKYCLEKNIQLPSLRRILSAGAPIPTQLHRDFQKIVNEGVEIFTPYGATETLPVASIGSIDVLEETAALTNQGSGTCVGFPVPEITVKIVRIRDEVIAEWSDDLCLEQGQIGEICVKGLVVTTEYKEEPEKTALAKIYQAGEVWHRMGDVGYFDEKGRLWFCGRKSHRVILSDGRTLFPVPCEAIFNQNDLVARTALVGVDGEAVLIVEPKEKLSAYQKKELEEELLQMAKQESGTSDIKKLLYHSSFPVDVRHNAKIHRPDLAVWAKEQLS